MRAGKSPPTASVWRLGAVKILESDAFSTSNSLDLDARSLICVGASVRAMAFSAIRAGFRPICFDYFADADLQRAVSECGSSVTKITGYDDSTLRLLEQLPSDIPLMYGGAVENAGWFVDLVAEHRPVWGATGRELNECRDPWAVQHAMSAGSFGVLECRRVLPDRADRDRWIWKPFASGGGVDIDNPDCGKVGYWQERVGPSYHDEFYSLVGVRHASKGLLFMGRAEHISPHVTEVRSTLVTPDELPDVSAATYKDWRIADSLSARLGLVGIFGIDLARDDFLDGPRVLEVNPRYTATAELHERLSGVSLVSVHALAFDDSVRATCWEAAVSRAQKAVLFAPHVVRSQLPMSTPEDAPFSCLLDIPTPGSRIDCGEPICSVIFDDVPTADLAARLAEAKEYVLACCPAVRRGG